MREDDRPASTTDGIPLRGVAAARSRVIAAAGEPVRYGTTSRWSPPPSR
jgi:hypothetical protein